jgi:regulator of protease activity HflC (stomatin/prohibitin superfamily)
MEFVGPFFVIWHFIIERVAAHVASLRNSTKPAPRNSGERLVAPVGKVKHMFFSRAPPPSCVTITIAKEQSMETVLVGVLVLAGISLLTGVRVLREYERGVVFRLGRARKSLAGPGLVMLLPFGIDRARIVDTRIQAIQIPPQEVITRDNISIVVSAVVYANVASPRHAILEVEEFLPATLQLAATTLRAVVGKLELDDILSNREGINSEVRNILDTRTEQWGVEITAVELKDIELPQEMKRAMARQAEAERERRAKVIAAGGEVQAAAQLAEAARMIASTPGALQLRLYQTLVEVSAEARSTIVFPVPIDMGGTSNAAGLTQAQIQTMMQSAVALASSQENLRLAEVDAEKTGKLPGR